MPTVNRDYSRPEYTVHLPKARRKKELDDQKKRMLAEQQRAAELKKIEQDKVCGVRWWDVLYCAVL